MTNHSSTEVPHLSKELRVLRSKKETLQNVIKIAHALSRLNQGLQAALLLGRSASKVPKHAVRFYDALKQEVKSLPTNVLQQDLDKILAIAAAHDPHDTQFAVDAAQAGAEGLSQDDVRVHKMLDEYRRRAQTAVCLRVILRERGITTAPLVLPIPEERLQQHINALEVKETQYKVKIRSDVVALKNDVEVLLKNTDFPDAIKQELLQTQRGLQQNIEHIDAGKDLDNLPFMIEAVESAETAYPVTEVVKTEFKSAAIQKPLWGRVRLILCPPRWVFSASYGCGLRIQCASRGARSGAKILLYVARIVQEHWRDECPVHAYSDPIRLDYLSM